MTSYINDQTTTTNYHHEILSKDDFFNALARARSFIYINWSQSKMRPQLDAGKYGHRGHQNPRKSRFTNTLNGQSNPLPNLIYNDNIIDFEHFLG